MNFLQRVDIYRDFEEKYSKILGQYLIFNIILVILFCPPSPIMSSLFLKFLFGIIKPEPGGNRKRMIRDHPFIKVQIHFP